MESWLSSAAPKRGRISTPGTKSRTSCKLAPRDSRISWESTREAPPGTRSSSRRVSSSLRTRSGVALEGRGTPLTTTGGSCMGCSWASPSDTHSSVNRTMSRTGIACSSFSKRVSRDRHTIAIRWQDLHGGCHAVDDAQASQPVHTTPCLHAGQEPRGYTAPLARTPALAWSEALVEETRGMFRGTEKVGHEPGKRAGARRIPGEGARRLVALRREAARGAEPYTPLPQGCAGSGRGPGSQATAGPGHHARQSRRAVDVAR